MKHDSIVNISDKKHNTLSIWNKIGYGMGEAGSQFSWSLISSYLTIYYTDVVGLLPAVISLIMLIARMWDAINDPMFGAIAENTHTKLGRYRPYILYGAPFMALLNCLVFLNLDLPMTGKAIWCGITYILCGMSYTAVNISVGCLANSMTTDNQQRVSLNAFRGIMGGLVQTIIGAVTIPLIIKLGNGSTSSSQGYFLTAVIFSLLSIPCFLLCVIFTKETVETNRYQKRNNTTKALFRSFQYTFSDRNALLLILAELTFLTGVFCRLGIMAYYFIYVLNRPQMIATFSTAMSLGMLIVNFYAPFFLNRINKKTVGMISSLLQAFCCIAFIFIGQEHLYSFSVIVGFLYGATNLGGIVSYTLSAEIIDDNWLRTGIRSDGVIYSCISFSTKLGSAIGGAVGIFAMGLVGFEANTQMGATTLTKINAVINFGPAILFLLASALFAMNGMTNKLGKENEKLLNEKFKN